MSGTIRDMVCKTFITCDSNNGDVVRNLKEGVIGVEV